MPVTVKREGKSIHGKKDGKPSLVQKFTFSSTTGAAVAFTLLNKPFTGKESLFGPTPGSETPTEAKNERHMKDFSPVPGFVFDVHFEQKTPSVFIVTFSQPKRKKAFLKGQAVWTITEGENGTVLLDEQVNTDVSVEHGAEPLVGEGGWSLRRSLFFKVGHKQVMTNLTTNIAKLLNASDESS